MDIIKKIKFLMLIGLIQIGFANQFGTPSCTIRSECLDTNHPTINEWVKAGVEGGIPQITKITKIIDDIANLQDAINTIGSGVILIKEGDYSLTKTITLKKDVVLRGEDRDKVIFHSKLTGESGSKSEAFLIPESASGVGFENFTILYDVTDNDPVERTSLTDGWYCAECFANDPYGLTNLYSRGIKIESSNNWFLNINILRSGSDPLFTTWDAHHNTFKNILVDQAYNKGGGGNGYFDLRGDYNLVTGSTFKRIRHFAIQQNAQYNVVIDNHFEVDINFHNGDDGYNLIEGNVLERPSWHSWGSFASGGETYGHSKPGENNTIYKNSDWDYKTKESFFSDSSIVYLFDDFTATGTQPYQSNLSVPICKTFYPMSCADEITPIETITNPSRAKMLENGQQYNLLGQGISNNKIHYQILIGK